MFLPLTLLVTVALCCLRVPLYIGFILSLKDMRALTILAQADSAYRHHAISHVGIYPTSDVLTRVGETRISIRHFDEDCGGFTHRPPEVFRESTVRRHHHLWGEWYYWDYGESTIDTLVRVWIRPWPARGL